MSAEPDSTESSGPGREKIPREDLLAELRAAEAVLGRAPTMTEMNEFGEYSASVYRSRFGGWLDALEAADIHVAEWRWKIAEANKRDGE